jgi:flagellar biosynthesis regulator FlbT
LNGAAVKMDRESTLEFYNHMQPFNTTLTTVSSPQGALPFLNGLAKWAKIAAK